MNEEEKSIFRNGLSKIVTTDPQSVSILNTLYATYLDPDLKVDKFHETEVALMLWEIVNKTCLFAVEGTIADSDKTLDDGTEEFLKYLTNQPKWSTTRYMDVIRVLQDNNRDAIPPYLLKLLQETLSKIQTLCNSSQHNININKG